MRIETIARLVEALIGLADLLVNLLSKLEPKEPKGKDGEKKKKNDGDDEVLEFC